MRIRFILFFLLAIHVGCTPVETSENRSSEIETTDVTDLAAWVNPFVGTSNMGHTYPGATAPFGMVQATPLTNYEPLFEEGRYNPDTYRYCAGYQYDDSLIYGFCHTAFSGTGHSDLGDIVVMPTVGNPSLLPGEITEGGFASRFRHETETASPGYYSVQLDDYNTYVELAASTRTAMHKYTYAGADTGRVVLDLMSNIYDYDDKNVWTFLRVENDTLITGYRQTKGWARTRTVYFAIAFSRPISEYGHQQYNSVAYNGFYRRFDEHHNFPEIAGRDIRSWFDFALPDDGELLMKVGLSCTSTHGALLNLQTENPDWDFERFAHDVREDWNRELNVVDAQFMNDDDRTTFYTALYHSMLSPIVYEDVDGTYRGLDQNNYLSDGFENYTVFSLWDTYRALHPLNNLLHPERNRDMIASMLKHQEQSVHGMLPIWSHYANENWCMIGYHAVSVIQDAVASGNAGFDVEGALEACVETARVGYFDGVSEYCSLGYVPEDVSGSSVSKTLEFAYDDWCIARLAEHLGKDELVEEFDRRSEAWLNVYDEQLGFMRPKLSDGTWKEPFDPMDTHGQGFIEGNAWNYGLYVPQDPTSMIQLMGGKEVFTSHLDSLFTMELAEEYIAQTEDITRDGIIGNYVHGNEPGHHIPYLYNWTDEPAKTQARVRMIMDSMYGPGNDGLCGNDDAGQMSAWYIFSALGFYPVCPGSGEYAVGSPLITEAVIHLPNGKTLEIHVENQSPENVYVERLEFNGASIPGQALSISELLEGGMLKFSMTHEAVGPESIR
ncbi:MAG: GH92 family glycosyl hydrolase [Flavobacteriales bacterium]|nr:GH92 family glycosyl hydrolase [Flavobacteriales bacterium]